MSDQDKKKRLKKSNGRPISFGRRCPTVADAKIAKALTAIGLSMEVVALELETSKDTLERWCKDYPAMNAAIETGRALRRKRAYNCFYSQAFPVDDKGKPTGKGDPSLMIFWMKTRERWREPAKRLEIEGNAERPIIEFALKEAPKDKD